MKATDELLTVEQFADRLNIGRTTVFDWMKSGLLVQGQHFLKIGRVIRFPWGDELIQALATDSLKIAPTIKIGTQTRTPIPPLRRGS